MTKKWFLLTFFLAVSFSGCSSETYRAEKAFWKAEQLLKQAQAKETAARSAAYEPVIFAFSEIAESYPATPKALESLFVVANLRIRQKKYEDAIKTLEKIIQNYSENSDSVAEARYGIANLYEALKNWSKAESVYWETAESQSTQIKGLYAPVHVMIHYKKVQDPKGEQIAYERAIEHYQRLLKSFGPIEASATITNYQALAHLTHGNWREARKTWLSISKTFPANPYAPMALLAAAETSWKQNEIPQAIKIYKQYFKLYPKHPLVGRSEAQLGILYQHQKDPVKAREWFEKALLNLNSKRPGEIADTKTLIGRTYQEEGKWEEAKKIYDEVAEKYGNTNAALQIPFFVAEQYEKTGAPEKAKEVLDRALERYKDLESRTKDPDRASFVQRLQNAAYAEKGDWAKVIENFNGNIKREKSLERKANWIFLKAFVTEKRLEDRVQALDLYKDFLAQFPQHPLAKMAKSRQDILLRA